MYNNYWNPNQNMMYPNAVPSVNPNYQHAPNYIPSEDPNYRMTYPNAVPSIDSNYKTMYPNSSEDSDYQFSQNNVPSYRNEREQKAYLYGEDAQGRTELGHGFMSFSWAPEIIEPNQYLIAYLHAPKNMNVINGGWKISSPNDPVFAIESYDRQLNQWIITLYNASERSKQITFTLIAKMKA
ncbi:hypothetical protein [Bacillus cereus group sp. BfR-BA-01355]|uniref:hypothetical protein n=1 Tax=Bacillus cereus group sp. BfR-BA-01355 TaxID=2920318 RepID=UPI001F586352|nr:hypothetical protein [Bacillus cereus group sp. BfR-BA-01355]